MMDKQYISQLVEKFLDGRTTNSEEQELYDWFRQNKVPTEWQELKSMFAWYESGMTDHKTAKPKHKMSLRWGIIGGIAASIAIVLTMWPTKQVNIYEGSYIVTNGIINNDIEYIEEDIEAVLARADTLELKANKLLAWADMQ